MKLFRRFKKPRATIEQPLFTPEQEVEIAKLADEIVIFEPKNLIVSDRPVIKPITQIPVKVADELPPPDQITFEPANADDVAQAKAAYKQAVKSVLLNKLRSY